MRLIDARDIYNNDGDYALIESDCGSNTVNIGVWQSGAHDGYYATFTREQAAEVAIAILNTIRDVFDVNQEGEFIG